MNKDELKTQIEHAIKQMLPQNNFENPWGMVLSDFRQGNYVECINELSYFAKVYEIGEINLYHVMSIICDITRLMDD